jgi:ATP-dependent Lhr-like helicase
MLWMMKSQPGGDGGAEIIRWLKIQYPIDENSARSIYEIFRQQAGFLGDDGIPAPWRIVVQESQEMQSGRRICYVLSGYGLRFNEALARMASYLLARQRSGEIFTAASDSGFVLFIPASSKASLKAVMASIREENCELLLRRALEKTSLLKSLFRINAARCYLILKSYKGRQRSARHQQLDADMLFGLAESLEDFAVLEESYREIIEDRLEVKRIKEVLRGLASGEIEVVVKAASTPCPMAFGLASLGAAAGERREMMKEMQAKVLERMEGIPAESRNLLEFE